MDQQKKEEEVKKSTVAKEKQEADSTTSRAGEKRRCALISADSPSDFVAIIMADDPPANANGETDEPPVNDNGETGDGEVEVQVLGFKSPGGTYYQRVVNPNRFNRLFYNEL